MNTTVAIVWILVTVNNYNGNQVQYSPPMPTQEACQTLKQVVQSTGYIRVPATCVQYQMSTAVSK